MVKVLKSYLSGQWESGKNDFSELCNPTTEEIIAKTSTKNFDLLSAVKYAKKAGISLHKLSFKERGKLLSAMSQSIYKHREELIELAILNGGNTRNDAKFDIDGATTTLSYYANLGISLGDKKFLIDDLTHQIGRTPRMIGRHILAPFKGVAVHINAFNFPAWGMMEKISTTLLAGMPIISKPATSTSLVSFRIAEILIEEKILPQGVFSFLCGPISSLLDHLDSQDVITFTGSFDTALKIRTHQNVLKKNIRLNIEADSLNAALLAPDITQNTDVYDLFLREVCRDITQKAGQKCTAIRRIFVTENQAKYLRDDLCEELSEIKYGNPSLQSVRVGPLATKELFSVAQKHYQEISHYAKILYGDGSRGNPLGIENDKGYFMTPTLLEITSPEGEKKANEYEIFAPVATLITYNGSIEQAIQKIKQGGGSLVSSLYSNDSNFIKQCVEGVSPYLGRIHIGNSKNVDISPGPGTVLPFLQHGGPGRSGGGYELGGIQGMLFYMQRTALQGYAPLIENIIS